MFLPVETPRSVVMVIVLAITMGDTTICKQYISSIDDVTAFVSNLMAVKSINSMCVSSTKIYQQNIQIIIKNFIKYYFSIARRHQLLIDLGSYYGYQSPTSMFYMVHVHHWLIAYCVYGKN